MNSEPTARAARYRFGDGVAPGLLLGLSMRQATPLIIGVLWLTVALMAQVPLVGAVGPVVAMVVSFGRWRRAPLHEVAAPGARLLWRRWRSRRVWVRSSLLGSGPGFEHDVPDVLTGIEVLDVPAAWLPGQPSVAVVHDRPAGTVSMVLRVAGEGFAVGSLLEQDGMVGAWGAALAPLARAQCPVARITWQEWSHPVGVAGHREFLASTGGSARTDAAFVEYRRLLDQQAPFTIAHDVLVTVTVDLRRVRSRRRSTAVEAGVESVCDEVRLLTSRLETGDLRVDAPLSSAELSAAIRLRSDPIRVCDGRLNTLRRSLSAAVGKGAVEWGPMAVEPDWFHLRVDGSVHRSFRIATWPMLPVAADWLAPLLVGDAATRTVTVVAEPVPLSRAAQDANRQLTSIEADQQQKEKHGFRLTAREHRRRTDVETRERELAEGHPEFRHVGFVTVTAADLDQLDDACARVEQAAAQSMLDLRPLAARQAEGWVASLPLGRSVQRGRWA